MNKASPQPELINLHQKSRILEIAFDDGQNFELSCELLRVYSPSAEVKGHGPGQSVLQTGKENVSIKEIEPVGHYAVKLIFDDGHETGLYSWAYLYELGENKETLWQDYLQALKDSGHQRQEVSV
ncbi:MAG: 1-(5-phosphoribosyl)-5-((5-phosphoribosylamino)methylideneamino)imidazole-4-carboxamide isomerase [Gammaproteobacteria bacterium]|nr:MAG: 1-(5-phosphoribosyl)-5-((5-phosphoribosylamino)methylideneamino)imidazole-4-carboxamide isomerase [Gammaproteobacteria bacterium]